MSVRSRGSVTQWPVILSDIRSCYLEELESPRWTALQCSQKLCLVIPGNGARINGTKCPLKDPRSEQIVRWSISPRCMSACSLGEVGNITKTILGRGTAMSGLD